MLWRPNVVLDPHAHFRIRRRANGGESSRWQRIIDKERFRLLIDSSIKHSSHEIPVSELRVKRDWTQIWENRGICKWIILCCMAGGIIRSNCSLRARCGEWPLPEWNNIRAHYPSRQSWNDQCKNVRCTVWLCRIGRADICEQSVKKVWSPELDFNCSFDSFVSIARRCFLLVFW
jgi:hypothetical protein